MIRDSLIPALRERFPEITFSFLDTAQPFARLTCPCTDIGDLEIYDDGDEATVALTKITHSHFNPYSKMPDDARDAWITDAVLDYLDALFADRLLLYCSPDRRQAGSQHHDAPIDRAQSVPGTEQYDCYVWSGPVARDT